MSLLSESTEKKPEIQPKVETAIPEEPSPQIKSEENQVNWKKYREQMAQERKERHEIEQREAKAKQEAEALKKAMEAILNKPEPQQQYQQEESEEDRISRKVKEALEKERIRIENLKKEEDAANCHKKLQDTYKDYYQTISAEHLDYLDYHYPKISKRLSLMPEGYDKWEAIYEEIKEKVPFGNKKEDQSRIDKNLQKPQAHSPNITDNKPIGVPWKLSEERKKENWKRMQQERKSF